LDIFKLLIGHIETKLEPNWL